uniref:Odorant receptor n=1 Tax=Microplitis mediator TaxID=375433 RepID=A0A0H4KP01_9HYME|nr:odorant receptor 51 [Microplitis mediator]
MKRKEKKNSQTKKKINLTVFDDIEYTQQLLSILAIWPLVTKSSTIKKILSWIHLLVIIGSLIWNILFRCIFIYIYVKKFDDQIMLIGPTFFRVIILLKYLAIIYHRKTIKKIFNHIQTDRSGVECQEQQNIMMRNVQINRHVTLVFAIFMYSSGTFYNFVMPHILPLLTHRGSRNTSQRLTIFPGYNVLSDVQKSPIYEITFFFHIFSVFAGFSVLVLACNIAVVLVTHACGQIQIIIGQLNSLIDDFTNNEKTLYIKFSSIISRHIRVIQFSNNIIKDALYETCLVEIGASSVLICIVEFLLLKMIENQNYANMIPYAMLLASLTLSILIICYFSELLESQFIEAGIQAYSINWYQLPPKARKYLILIIIISQRSYKITAGGIIDLSYIAFVQILKTGFAYLQLLRATK